MSSGLAGNREAKIKGLKELTNTYTDSNLKDDALFELAATYTSKDNISKANTVYNTLLKEVPQSSYTPSVILRQGLLYYGQGKNTKALAKFKDVVAKYPNSNESRQAVTNARHVYVDLGKVNEYAAWVKKLDFVNLSNSEIDNTTYEAAENKFLENDSEKAITGFETYLNNFPNGLHANKANFYLAKLLFKKGLKEEATPHFLYVINLKKNQFSEESLAKMSQIYLEDEDWNGRPHKTQLVLIGQNLDHESLEAEIEKCFCLEPKKSRSQGFGS